VVNRAHRPERLAWEQALALSPCPGCGFDYEAHTTADALDQIATGSAALCAILGGSALPGADVLELRRRPSPETWSGLEYCCHVRDVLIAERERAILALLADHPHFTPLYREQRVALAHYNEEPPSALARGLEGAASLLGWLYRDLSDAQLERACIYDLPDPTEVDVGWLVVHTAHEVVHHLGDVERGAEAIRR
jgi:hypothetical protein